MKRMLPSFLNSDRGNTMRSLQMHGRTGKWKPDEEVVTSTVPAIIEPHLFEQVQLHARSPKVAAPPGNDGTNPPDRPRRVRNLQWRNDVVDAYLEDRHRPSLLYVLDLCS
jgi:hypothetical protein